MNSLFAIIISAIFYVLSGWHLTYLLPSIHKIERVGLAFLIGSGLTTFVWFFGYRAGLPFNLLTLSISGGILATVGYNLSVYLHLKPIYSRIILSKNEQYLFLSIIVMLFLALLIGSYNPLTAWDSIALYDFRGHAIAINHNLKDITDLSYYISYPLMISLVHSVVYMLGGINAQGIHAIIFSSFIAVVYGRVRSWTNNKYALLTCILIICQKEIFNHSTFAYTNLPYIAYLVSGILYSVSAKNNKSFWILFSGILFGISTWVRASETFWIIGALLITVQGFIQKNKIQALFSVLLLLAIHYAWTIYYNAVLVSINYTYEQTLSSFGQKNVTQMVSNWREIYDYINLYIYLPYQGFWFLVVPTTLVSILKKDIKLFLLLGTVILTGGMVVLGIMVFSTYYTTWNQIGDSARRMIMFIMPLTIITAVYALHLIFGSNQNERKS